MNLDEVAKLAGVSAATVSRVLNNLDVVRDATRDRVMRAVSELNYHPNLHARSLAGGKSRTIGMIASNLENPFFFDIFRTLEADSHAHGYEVVAAHTGYSPEQLVRSVRLMIGRRVAGLAVIVSEMAPDLIHELELSRIPTVFYDVGAGQAAHLEYPGAVSPWHRAAGGTSSRAGAHGGWPSSAITRFWGRPASASRLSWKR